MPTISFDKFCPTCGSKQMIGALACEFCGTPFNIALADPTTTRQVDQGGLSPEAGEHFMRGLASPQEGLALHMPGKSTPFAIQTQKSFIVGRRGPEDTKSPLVDLSQFNGFEMGVSRQHVMIRRSSEGYEVVDLESRNGTWLDDQRLVPNRAYAIPGRAQIRLGMLRLFVIYRRLSDSQGQA
jgi:hypothetical protein